MSRLSMGRGSTSTPLAWCIALRPLSPVREMQAQAGESAACDGPASLRILSGRHSRRKPTRGYRAGPPGLGVASQQEQREKRRRQLRRLQIIVVDWMAQYCREEVATNRPVSLDNVEVCVRHLDNVELVDHQEVGRARPAKGGRFLFR